MQKLFILLLSLLALSFPLTAAYSQSEVFWDKPDAVMTTQNLRDLPKDILKQPMMKEVLTEDFAFYYVESADYLSLSGALKRIAFERNLTLFDTVLSYIMSSPADLVFWKAANGRLDHFMLSIERTVLSDLMTFVGKVSVDDKQLKKLKDIKEGEDSFTIYELRYGYDSTLYFTVMKDKLVVYSNADMPLPTANRLKSWINDSQVLSPVSKNGFFSKFFSGSDETPKHKVYLSMEFLTFGYYKYLKNLDTINFTYAEKSGWSMHGLFSGGLKKDGLVTNDLWKALARNPALCLSLPLNKVSLSELLVKNFAEANEVNDIKEMAESFENLVALCWYPESKFYTPVAIVKTSKATKPKLLNKIFTKTIGNLEGSEDEQMPAAAVTETKKGHAVLWTRKVSSRNGLVKVPEASKNKFLFKKYFNVQLAQSGNYLIFSADDKLTERVLSVLDKRSPAMSEEIPSEQSIAAVIFPGKLATLLKSSILESLSPKEDVVFKDVVMKKLLPTLDKMKTMNTMSLLWPQEGWEESKRWENMKWLSSAPR